MTELQEYTAEERDRAYRQAEADQISSGWKPLKGEELQGLRLALGLNGYHGATLKIGRKDTSFEGYFVDCSDKEIDPNVVGQISLVPTHY